MRSVRILIAVCALATVSACGGNGGEEEAVPTPIETPTAAPGDVATELEEGTNSEAVAAARRLASGEGSESERAAASQRARAQMQGLRVVVDQSDRELRIYRGDTLLRKHKVAVGTEKNPTPIGEFAFHRVDLNPRWVPPDSEWAQDAEPKPAGHPENPMGRARLVYQMAYTVHGTDDLNSLGKAVSHGSIRLANEHVIPLAEMFLKAGGAWEGQSWFSKMTQNRTTEYEVPLEQDVPLKIQE